MTLFDAATHGLQATLPAGDDVRSVTFSPDGHVLAVGTQAGEVVRWDVTDVTSPRPLPPLEGSGDGKRKPEKADRVAGAG